MTSYKKILLSLFLIINCTYIYAITPTGSVTAIGQTTEIGDNIFPISTYLTYDVLQFNLVDGYPGNMTFDMAGGYAFRSVIQDPISGIEDWYSSYEETEDGFYFNEPYNEYGAIFSQWDTKFIQILPISEKIPGQLDVWLGASGHYEQAVDLLQNYRETNPYENTIFTKLQEDINDGVTTFYGIAELNGNRYIHDFSFNLGTTYKNTYQNTSYNFKIVANFAPYWLLNNLDQYGMNSIGGHTNYLKVTPTFTYTKTFYESSYNDLFNNKEFRLLKITLSDVLTYRYLLGSAVPQYRIDADNLRHDVNNRLSLNFYGPQFIESDNYPSLSLFYYQDFKWGKLNNLNPNIAIETNPGEFNHNLGVTLDLRLINIIHFGYQGLLDLKDFSLQHIPYFYVQL